jgi:DNA-binding NarL/FixJ family response regulator
MNKAVKILLQVDTRHHRDSLAALLGAMSGVEILISTGIYPKSKESENSPSPDILLFEDKSRNSPGAIDLMEARRLWPALKTVMLVDSTHFSFSNLMNGVDIVLPVSTTAGELQNTIGRLVNLD